MLVAIGVAVLCEVISAASPADIVPLPCRDTNNFDASSCLFSGDYCDFNADFSKFYDQAMNYHEYVKKPDPLRAEFIVESGLPRIEDGALTTSLVPPLGSDAVGTATIVSTSRFLLYGTFEARLRTSGHGGVVTSFIGFSNDKDEIDMEHTGLDSTNVQANWYYRGYADTLPSNGASVNGFTGNTIRDNSENYYTYTMKWTQESISWLIDGELMHQSFKNISGSKGWPDTPMRISFGIWQTSPGSDWAGLSDIKDWSKPISASFQTLSVSCLAGPHRSTDSSATINGGSVSPPIPTHPPTGYDPDRGVSAVDTANSSILVPILAFIVAMVSMAVLDLA